MSPEAQEFNRLLVQASKYFTLFYLLPIGIALWNRRHWNRPLRIFFTFLVITFLLNGLEQLVIWGATTYYPFFKPYMDQWQISNVLFLYILFYLRDFLLLGYFYALINYPESSRPSILNLSLAISVFAVINYLFIDGFRGYGVIGPTLDALFCFLLPAYYLWGQRTIPYPVTIGKIPYYWFSLGLILQNLMGLFFYYTADKLQQSDFKLYIIAFLIKNVFDMLGVLLFTYGFYQARYVRFLTKAA
ncbi:MAG: hypothetical protein EOO39_23310 [Cytophagaceae bacterium]|nr:MAG: hypothetical protein EOO39_23310 [Cytophagaceae bacterium]